MLTVKLTNKLGGLFLILRFHIPKFITQMCKEIYEFCMEGRCENKNRASWGHSGRNKH